MRKLELPHRSYLHPMIHVFKNASGKIVRQVLCYSPQGTVKEGKANHKYDPVGCGWQQPMTFIYSGPLFACRRCHRHIWAKESYSRCPQCGSKLNAQETVLAHPAIPAERGIPEGGRPNVSQFA